MLEFKNQESALTWIKGRNKRMLFINMQVCTACKEYKENELYPWIEKTLAKDWQFAEIHHDDWQLFADKFPKLSGSHIIPLGAPLPITYLNSLLEI